MKRLITLTSMLLISYCSFSQQVFYIQQRGIITKVENIDPSKLAVIKWQVRLYKKGASKTGNSNWGVINGNSANEVMTKLKKEQDFELQFNAFIGKGKVQDNVLTYFNPLGPIAILEESNERTSSNEEFAKLSELYEKAKDFYDLYVEVKENVDKIIKAEPTTPFVNVGNVFKEYTDNLKEIFTQISSLRNMYNITTQKTIDEISKNINMLEKESQKIKIKYASNVEPLIDQENKIAQNSFYIFLVTTISIKPSASQFSNLQSSKTLYVISAPLLHLGNLNDMMQNEKKQFMADIKKQFINRPDLLKEIESKGNNPNIEIHFGKPYSQELLGTSSDAYKAIEAYKNSTKKMLAGLSLFEFVEL